MTLAACPCGRPQPYEACCARFHAGAEPPDAESLMRSRYVAFVKKDAPYLYRTLHPKHEDHAQGEAAFLQQMKRHFAERVVYRKLEVLDTDGPAADATSRVLFIAHMSQRGKDCSFAELSWFASDGVGLRYLSGRNVPLRELGDRRTIAAFER